MYSRQLKCIKSPNLQFFKTCCTCINWLTYLPQTFARFCSPVFFISLHPDSFCVHKHSSHFVKFYLEGWQSVFFKKKCASFLSIFSKLCVKNYCIIEIIRRPRWISLSNGVSGRGGVSTLPPYQLSLPSPRELKYHNLELLIQSHCYYSIVT